MTLTSRPSSVCSFPLAIGVPCRESLRARVRAVHDLPPVLRLRGLRGVAEGNSPRDWPKNPLAHVLRVGILAGVQNSDMGWLEGFVQVMSKGIAGIIPTKRSTYNILKRAPTPIEATIVYMWSQTVSKTRPMRLSSAVPRRRKVSSVDPDTPCPWKLFFFSPPACRYSSVFARNRLVKCFLSYVPYLSLRRTVLLPRLFRL